MINRLHKKDVLKLESHQNGEDFKFSKSNTVWPLDYHECHRIRSGMTGLRLKKHIISFHYIMNSMF